MTSDVETTPAPAAASGSIGDKAMGFLAFVDHTGIARSGTRSQGLDDGIDLFQRAEGMGLDAGYVRHRHLQAYLSAPLPFLAAVGMRTSALRLGTALIPLRFENAGRLAEDIATTDLLTGGRLHIGMGSGYAKQDAVNVRAFGAVGDVREKVDATLGDVISFLDGEVVSVADEFFETEDEGTELVVRPQAPTVRSRLAYGAGSVTSAEMAGRLGIGLQVSTLAPTDGTGRSFEELQLEVIDAYRAASREAGHGDGHVSASRQVLPVTDQRDLVDFQYLIDRDRTRQEAMLREGGAPLGGRRAMFGRVVADAPEVVAKFLAGDVALQAADEAILALPFGHPYEVVRKITTTFGERVVPLLREVR
ncbi:LLM class flavin-dependent oxidoreductase [Enemella evansiae]|uniref:LLM class flavin-dependent oxidoreductase n=1 Tax=Enemella evansiae TaxID=2016499 RepID=UPI000B97C4C4|nr:LLM class flavin-dependent oxidoreductase [Enemella evansiae]OYO16970.1 LLM class flavin-dependent oxidoreductase [Enemella evansiae]